MNKQGFTLIEIMVSIALVAIVLVFMFNLLGDIKREDALSNNDIADALNRATITRLIQNDFIEKGLTVVNTCNRGSDIMCYEFTFKDNSKKYLDIRRTELEYDNEIWKLDSGEYTTENGVYCSNTAHGDNYYLKILIPVINYNLDNRLHDIEIIRMGKGSVTFNNSDTC